LNIYSINLRKENCRQRKTTLNSQQIYVFQQDNTSMTATIVVTAYVTSTFDNNPRASTYIWPITSCLMVIIHRIFHKISAILQMVIRFT
jgi:hypothetical protein